jgi:hypothetical protein
MLKIPVHKLGRWVHPKYGVIEGTQKLFDEMIQNFRNGVLGREPYAEFGHSEKASQAVAQAWVKDFVQEGGILYALAEPTDPAVESLIRSKKIRYSSPEYEPNFTNRETGKKVGAVLKAVGLLNNPFLTKLGEVVALSEDEEVTFVLDAGEEPKRMEIKDLVAGIQTGLSGLFQKQTEDLKGMLGTQQQPAAVKLSEEDQRTLDEAKAIKARELKLSEQEKQFAQRERKLAVDEMLEKHAKAGIPKAVLDAAEPILLSDLKADQTVQLSDEKGNPTTKISLSDALEKVFEAFPAAARVEHGKSHGTHQPPKKDAESTQLSDDEARAEADRILGKSKKEA